MKNHYELLGVAPTAAAEDIKRAFRREIARYHPDKVQHLGPEFQEIAATRAAELTEAYRVLMDEEARRRYDEESTGSRAPGAARVATPASEPHTPPPPTYEAPFDPPRDRGHLRDRAATSEFLRKAVIARLREAVPAVSEVASVSSAPGIDAIYALKGKGGLFRKAEPPVRLLAKYVNHVDAAAVTESWASAATAGQANETVCLLLLGAGVAPARELAGAVAEARRKNRKGAPVVIAVDVRDWEALLPPEAPQSVRAIVQRLRDGGA